MLVSFVAVFVLSTAPAGEGLMDQARAYYRSLDSFSMTIEHRDSSGLFPGRYTQSLKWRKGGRFELIVTKPSDYVPKADQPGGVAPDYYCDGKTVVSVHRTGERTSGSLRRDPNSTPGWEVSGGLILSWLVDGSIASNLANPPSGWKIETLPGPEKTWGDTKVRTLVLRFSQGSRSLEAQMYFSTQAPELLGMEWSSEGKPASVRYLDQKRNPPLPETLGSLTK